MMLTEKTAEDSLALEYLNSKIGKFFIPTNVSIPDSNELFFYYGQQFDTSFLVHLKNDKDTVHGVVYQIARPYFKTEPEARQESLQFFEGYSFSMDLTRWRSITNEAARILVTTDSLSKVNEAFDAAVYILAFHSKVKTNIRVSDNVLLSGFASYLKDSLLNQCMSRKPQWHWEK